MEDIRYPIGRFVVPAERDSTQRAQWIDEIRVCPAALRSAVAGLTETQLDTPYRDRGWTVRQVVHHLPDSHINSYVRFKLALTEDRPTIRGYSQEGWAALPDGSAAPVDISLSLLDAVHRRWVVLLDVMSDADYHRTFLHPEMPETGPIPLDITLAHYAWHGRHHVAQIASLRERRGW